MARADLILDLVEAERRGDRDKFRVLVEAGSPRNVPTSTICWPTGSQRSSPRRAKASSVTIALPPSAIWHTRSSRTAAWTIWSSHPFCVESLLN